MLPMILSHKMVHTQKMNTNHMRMQLVSYLVQHTLRNSVFYQKASNLIHRKPY